MKRLLSVIVMVASLTLAFAAFAQSATSTLPIPANPAAEPVTTSKKFACQTASQGSTGQERKDLAQLCVAQAHIDCLKQAIDKKIVGPQRKDFVKSCVEQ